MVENQAYSICKFGDDSYADNDELTNPPKVAWGKHLTNREMRTGVVCLNPNAVIYVVEERDVS